MAHLSSPHRELIHLRSQVTVRRAAEDEVELTENGHVARFAGLSEGQLAALDNLLGEPRTEPELLRAVRAHDGEHSPARLSDLLTRLHRDGWVESTLVDGDRPLVTVTPTGSPVRARTPVAESDVLVLSRFAILRRDGDRILLESPRAKAVVAVHDDAVVALLTGLRIPRPAASLTGPLSAEATAAVLEILRAHSLVVPGDEEERDFALRQWRPHELWFHSRTRLGRHDLPYGGTHWARDRFPALPSAREPFPGPAVPLARPDGGQAAAPTPAFTDVLERRQSVREHDDTRPITAEQLGEFLYRCARVRGDRPGHTQELTYRPYPSGGSIYELELYPVVSHVDGLASGIYHYDPFGHRLERVPDRVDAAPRLLSWARRITLMPGDPQVLIVITARFGRMMWKYESMAYAATLKNVGALYTTMYLVATAMGLAPCGVGGGDSDLFAEATGLDYYAESSVGEFVLGSRPPTAA
ncbi:SagB family peptide dehydrogenase [Streptoalloteichus hindustanus]|uniref:SagB-type dehydrogenase domain-containing protein n=1 Tax=Streptoalloteichus hindustanus TaxID=2017 RepID=A0A1M5EJQ6_STRHI|nr:SagB family peptide dehydrogenase [Streptoalloteichus hindustanus]SHF79350.1 SagB-type dehydrogenase domain-containing protein [Streptoalloteichus hindustanus]